jgi:hypothetical protein
LTQKRRQRVEDEAPLLFDLPLAAPPPADRRARRSSAAQPVQVDLFEPAGDEIDGQERGELGSRREEEEAQLQAAAAAVAETATESEGAGEASVGPVIAGVLSRVGAGLADAVLHLGVLGGAYLGVVALGVEPRIEDWPAFALLLAAFSFLSSVVSLAFWGQTAGMAWRRLQTRDRLQRPLTFRQAALRWTGGLLTFATAGLPLLFALGGSSLADWMSRTVTYSLHAEPHGSAVASASDS